ncbi:MAG: PBP1A family penicillin-binding protein [Nitrospirae bacterium]|nr:PBP1A family penicillin-binding protein [Nitrospirota bacterium]
MKIRTVIKVLLVFFILSAGAFYLFILKDLPSVEQLKSYKPPVATKVYADDNVLIGEFKIERGRYVSIKEIPQHLVYAVIATEDSRFFEHRGLDYFALLRALGKDIIHRRFKEGGSTITQQLAKILYLSHEKTLRRKVREAILAIRIERELSKEEILELYLNRAYFGEGAYGVEMASRVYFGKPVRKLDLTEAAMLAGLLKSPSYYSPYKDIKRAEDRMKIVLMRMEKEGFLRPSERIEAARKGLRLLNAGAMKEGYGYFLSYVRNYLEEEYGTEMVYKGGLHVYTTLRRWAQIQARRALREGLEAVDKQRGWRGVVGHVEGLNVQKELASAAKADVLASLKGELLRATVLRVYRDRAILKVNGAYAVLRLEDALWARKVFNPKKNTSHYRKRFSLKELLSAGDMILVKLIKIKDGIAYVSLEQEPLVQGALIAVQPETGYIEAMAGGYDFRKSQFNRAVNARRQAGSAFKPIVYALALQQGMTPATIIDDEPVSYPTGDGGQWTPVNYDRKYAGPVRLREALVRSLNVATVRLAESIGVEDLVSFAKDCGFKGDIPYDLSLSLGSLTVSPLQLTMCYTVFANRGVRMNPIAIKQVVSSDGRVLEFNIPEGQVVTSPEVAYIITSILQDVIQRGTGRRAAGLKVPSAGKTGTTDNFMDAWFVGYTPELLAGVWVGYDDPVSLGEGMSGGRVAAPIWLNFMRAVTRNDSGDFIKPDNVVKYYIDKETGLQVLKESKDAIEEYFIKGTEPEWKYMNRLRRLLRGLFGRTDRR